MHFSGRGLREPGAATSHGSPSSPPRRVYRRDGRSSGERCLIPACACAPTCLPCSRAPLAALLLTHISSTHPPTRDDDCRILNTVHHPLRQRRPAAIPLAGPQAHDVVGGHLVGGQGLGATALHSHTQKEVGVNVGVGSESVCSKPQVHTVEGGHVVGRQNRGTGLPPADKQGARSASHVRPGGSPLACAASHCRLSCAASPPASPTHLHPPHPAPGPRLALLFTSVSSVRPSRPPSASVSLRLSSARPWRGGQGQGPSGGC